MIYHYYMHQGSVYFLNTAVAVDFFFILSGFVIMHSYGERLSAGMSIYAYLGRRFIRLYPLMAMGIIIGTPALYLYTKLGNTNYTGHEIIIGAMHNLFFLPFLNDKSFILPTGTILGVIFPSDGPLWSIFFELVASIAFISLYKQKECQLAKVCLLSLILIILSGLIYSFIDYNLSFSVPVGWGTKNFMGGFPRVMYGFTCGMLLYQIHDKFLDKLPKIILRHPNINIFVLYTVLIASLLFPHYMHGLFYLIVITSIAPFLILWGSHINNLIKPFFYFSKFLGWISYPVYCLHTPVRFIISVINQKFDLESNTGISYQIYAIVATLLLSVIIAKIIDEPVRRWLNGKLNKFHSPKTGLISS